MSPAPDHPNVLVAGYDEVWAAGGVPPAVFPTTFDELVAVTGGAATAVADGS